MTSDARPVDPTPALPDNAEINDLLRAQAEAGLHRLHRPIERLATLLAQPTFLVSAVVLVVLWIAVNVEVKVMTRHPWDEPPFFWLQGLIGLLSLIVTGTVLVSQARQAQLAEQRAQLQLQIVLLTEQRSAKIIALLEELRRDLPGVRDRIDPEALAMQNPAEPQVILEALVTVQADASGVTARVDDVTAPHDE